MGIPSWNFNAHTELSDHDFVQAEFAIVNGRPPRADELAGCLKEIASGGRYSVYQGQVQWAASNGAALDLGNDWLKHVPDWAWLLGGIAAAGLFAAIVLKATLKQFKPNGISSDEY